MLSQGSLSRLKFHPSRQPLRSIVRTRLIDLVVRGSACPVTLLSAAAGYGKSTLMAQLRGAFADAGALTPWLTVDQDDDDPQALIVSLVLAIRAVGVDTGALLPAVQGQLRPSDIPWAVSELIQTLSSQSRPVALFIDDAHGLASPRARAILTTLSEALPSDARLVISSRNRMDDVLTRMRLAGHVLDVSAQQLSFDDAETDQVWIGGTMEARQMASIAEGWPVAVQLLRLIADQSPAKDLTLRTFRSHSPELGAYLTAHILTLIPDHLVVLANHMAFLIRANGDLLNHLCNRKDAWAGLEELSARTGLVFACGDDQTWYRQHPLLSDFLRQRTYRETPDHPRQIFAAASRWMERRGELSEALHYCIEAGDIAAISELTTRFGGWRAGLRSGASLLKYFPRLPAAVFEGSPGAAIACSYQMAMEGRIDEARSHLDRYCSAAKGAFPALGDETVELQLMCVNNVLRLYEDRIIEPSDAAELCQRAQSLAHADPEIHAVAEVLQSYAHFYGGDWAAFRNASRAAIAQCKLVRLHQVLPFVQMFQALADLHQGDLVQAEQSIASARATAASLFGADAAQCIMADVFTMELGCERHDVAAMLAGLQKFELIEHTERWGDVLSSGYRALLTWNGYCQPAAVQSVLGRALRTLQRGGMERTWQYVAMTGVQVLCAVDQPEAANALFRLAQSQALWNWTGDARLVESRVATHRLLDFASPVAEKHGRCVADEPAAMRTSSGRARHQWAMIQALRADAPPGDRPHAAELRRQGTQVAAVLESVAEQNADGALVQMGVPLRRRLAPLADLLIEQLSPPALRLLDRIGSPLGQRDPTAPRIALTPREAEVLGLLARGFSSKEMARTLGIAEGTIKEHRKRLYRKLSVQSRSEALRKRHEMSTETSTLEVGDRTRSLHR